MQGNPYYVDLAGNFASGYNTATLPQQMRMQQQAALQEQKMNAMKQAMMEQQLQFEPQMNAEKLKQIQMENEAFPENEKAKRALLDAQAAKASQPDKPSGEYFGLLQYYNSLPPGKEKDMTKQRLDILTSRGNGTTVYGENGQPIVQIGGSATSPGKLSTGEMPYYKTDPTTKKPVLDDSGNPIQEGIMRPATADELKELRGRYIFNNLYPKLNSIMSHYSGKDSWNNFMNDIQNMETNPKARQNIIDYYTATKLLPAVIAKEQQTLGASNTLGQFKVLQEKMNSSDLPGLLQKNYANFVMPSYVMDEAGKNMTETLAELTQGSLNVPGYIRVPFEAANDTPKDEDPIAKFKVNQ